MYEVPPIAETVIDVPEQSVGVAGLKIILGVAFTTIDTVPGCAEMQPRELVPDTENIDVEVGQTTLVNPPSTV